MKIIFILICLAFIVVYGLYFLEFHGSFATSQDVWGQFGDFVGGTLNPILTFITIYLLYKTIRLQQDSLQKTQDALSISRDTYELSKTELKKSHNFLESQNQLITLQKFEGAFFELSKLVIESVNSSKHNFQGINYTGSSGLEILTTKLIETVEDKKTMIWIDEFFDKNENYYSVIKLSSGIFSLINKSNLKDNEKSNYVVLLTSILPSSLISAICFIRLVGNWPITLHFEECGFYDLPGIKDSYAELKSLEIYRGS